MDLSIIEQYISEHQLLTKEDRIVIGVSGGADSVALLDILQTLGYECIVAHCNFHLRGEESNRDAKYVINLCKSYNLEPCYVDFDTEQYARKKSISIEMAARELRYNWFEEIRIKHNASLIAVAHHMDDSVETVLLNLIRGTGIRGMTGIKPRNGHIVRPLLGITRQQVVEYLAAKNITYVDDSTNSEDIYTRNKIRLNILPLLEEINPSAKKSINKTAQYLTQVQSIYDQYIQQAKEKLVKNNRIDIKAVTKQKEPLAVLYEILTDYDFNSATVNDIYTAMEGESGRVFYSDSHQILKDRKYLIIAPKSRKDEDRSQHFEIKKNTSTLSYPISLTLETKNLCGEFGISKDKSVLYLDYDKISFPLIIRKWQKGDWFVPFGLKGRKKVSDLFTNLKLNLFEKENTWILCSGNGDILWIIGLRSDERYRLDHQTEKVLQITLNQ